jgi:hypothetical protein
VVSEQMPAVVAADLPTKLQKRLLLCAHNAVPWHEASKSHRRLRDLGLVHEGTLDGEKVALGTPDGQAVAKVLERNT